MNSASVRVSGMHLLRNRLTRWIVVSPLASEAQREVADDHGAKLTVLSVVKPLTQVSGGLDMAAYTQTIVNFEREAQTQALSQLQKIGGRMGNTSLAGGNRSGRAAVENC